jgi:carbonic anhydrase/acetyltransferase-like protein (isoleucine patch superfamily)
MIRSFAGKTPRVAPDAFVSETAYVVGDVEIGAGSSVWPGAVVRGDVGPIRVGRNTHVEDNAVLHSATELDVGEDVMIGHGAVVHCRRIGRGCSSPTLPLCWTTRRSATSA